MARFARILLLLSLLVPPFAVVAQAKGASAAKQETTAQASSQEPAYVLKGDRLEKAIKVSHIRAVMHFVGVAWDVAALLVLLALGVPARFRNWAVGNGRNLFVQTLIFVPLALLVSTVIGLPLGIYMHHVGLQYGLSVQSWGSWFWDATKAFLMSAALTCFPAIFMKWCLQRRPETWWLWMWVVSIPMVVLLVFIAPVILDPVLNKFEPLQPSQPALVQRLEQVVARGGLDIPPSRMYLMKASLKTTQLNAYVTGLGPSKRVVVWDTSLQHATDDQILYIFGHEMGHYVLHHVPKTVAFICVLLLVMYYVGHRFLGWAVRSGKWGLTGYNDWVALVVLMLAFSVFSFFMEPVINAYSRHNEHVADVYGMEAVHGIVANPQQVAQSSFQLLGETSLVDPHPNAFVEFWSSSHPSIRDRAEFAAHYDPWKPGEKPRYFSR